MPSRSIEIGFAGQQLVLDGAGALYWPSQGTLVVSDMHLEKSTFLAQHGSFIAPYDTQDTLDRLEALIAYYRPRELILLGDSFHDRQAWERLDSSLRARIEQLSARVERCRWIEGNHDAALVTQGRIEFDVVREMHGISFLHEHRVQCQPQVIGHYHPKAVVALKGRHVRSACFMVTPSVLIMPAFGSYTGGLDIRHGAFQAILGEAKADVYLLYREKVYKLPEAS